MTDHSGVIQDVRQGMIPAHIYNDKEIFELEKERVFGRSWLFVAHESEVPEAGDYVVRRVLEDSFIISRDEHGEIRALFNMCLHRGMQVCRTEMGNASHFRCPYHGWSYRNDGRIVGLPFHKEAYGGEEGFKKQGQTLLPAPSLGIYNGLIFVSLDPDAEPLEDFLGDFKFYMDYYTKQSSGGIELRGPQRWRVKANWKIGAENFAGDMYHTPQTHTSVVEIGLFREPKAEKRKDGTTYWAGNGGGTTYKLPEGSLEDRLRYVGYPDEMIARMKEQWSQEQLDVVGKDGFMVSAASVFPNMSFVHNWPRVEEDSDEVLPFISIRQWQPISEDETEIVSWFAVDKNAPEEFKALSYKAYLMCFGSGGMFEQDDVENWVSLTSTAGGPMARRLLLNSRMGMLENGQNVVEPLTPEQYSGPGSTRVGYSEYNQRELLLRWANHLERPMEKAAQVHVGSNPVQDCPSDTPDSFPAPAEHNGHAPAMTVSKEG
ncbi:MAG: aromatic ring-hydroxylating dioxygenase subunit alpha [Rhodococcus sp. (in: high G+C Gram-positive bacteria)]|jgi:phenylpropionate dioxygenase-like ring-hydroxylating dioxygenase large terminal subunit|uniref:Aromatic ring-hydroxylating dioxygenase subunit alpha n=10 Tax=Actinomycetes TaxID=1760 RepID=A0AAE5AH21_MYCFO|nr:MULTISPECIES: aromatic ring-hydroxylating dioxygenase subunit alpha [Mycobacteriales]MCH2219049.1 aromatic ring-hydroxylating dioxygenase subunit alpha [Dechloromonas sp.]MDZ4354087.1 aromatic ring-hydroxylating dioxygenase subunit alpha [Arthrobacter sp.]ANE78226.1 aromatic-ring-hydroxylating dioxygenase subunit alpha [Mycobacterium adipatum]KLI04230.1 aromatic-ring-hydroxylating dioxygenase [Mycolicibacterium senegalense]KLO47359.1 aromatic-ring-hydroxylating dioxygenase [Mycolicibacteriu